MKKLKSSFLLIVLGVLVFFLYSCEFMDCIDGNGFITTESRLVAEFYAVENTTSFDVEIIADSVLSVEVTGDENLLSYINTKVRRGDLIIDMDYNRCINSNDISIEVHMPFIDGIESTGSGDMEVLYFDCENLAIKNSGSGDIELVDICSPEGTIDIVVTGSGDVTISGKANRGDYRLTGSGDSDAEDLRVDECYITSSGSGNIECFVYDLLDVVISGSGDVYYSGSPKIYEKITGSGELRER